MKTFKISLNVVLFFIFLLSLLTGLVKFPELKGYFAFLFSYFSASRISAVHDWSSIILLLLISIHLLLNKEYIVATYGGKTKPGRLIISVAIFIPLLFFIASVLLFARRSFPRENRPKTLASTEIKQYRGERLDSINHFRENSIKGPQHVNKSKYRLKISGLVDHRQELKYSQVLKYQPYKKVVRLNCVEGWSAKVLWQGVLLKDLLNTAGVKPKATTVIFYAADGYSTSLPLNYILKKNILLADKINGVVLPPERGFPFQLVAEKKWGYKWIKWITKIELSDNAKFKGYWERRGYSNNGDTSKPQFGD